MGQRPGRQEPIYECVSYDPTAMRRKTGENEKRRKTIDQKIQYGLDKCSTANFDDCNVQFLDPRERWRKMSIRGLDETDELQRKNARIKAHLKSDINYNWERIMQDGDRGKPTLRKKEHNKTSRFFGFASRGNKLEWTQDRKKKICKRNFQIPTIVVTEAL